MTRSHKPPLLTFLSVFSLACLVGISTFACPSQARAREAQKKPKVGKQSSVKQNSAKPAAKAAFGGDLNLAVKTWLNRPEIRHSRVGVEVMDLATGTVLFQSSGDKRHTPASTAKVITTACLYDLLGWDFVYKTKLLTAGTIKDGVLNGDLALETSEDPSFSRGDLASLVLSLRNFDGDKSGIKLQAVKGKIYQLSPNNGADNFHVHWLLEDFGQEWMPVSSSLVVDKNIAYSAGIPSTIKIDDGGSSLNSVLDGVLSADLASAFLIFDESTQTAKLCRGIASGSNGKPDPKVHKDGPFVVANPTAFNLALFSSTLAESGVEFDRRILRDSKVPGFLAKQPTLVLAEHSSKPLPQLIKLCLYESDNLYAQQFLRTIAQIGLNADKQGGGKLASKRTSDLEERGLARIGQWLSSIAVPNAEVILFDGCGLSRKNSVTPHALNLVLRYMAQKHPEYLDLLRSQGAGKGESGRFRFKTGAMETVRGITGVLDTAQGKKLAVTVLVNGHKASVSDVRIVIADLIERLRRVNIKEANSKEDNNADKTPTAAESN